MRTKNLITIGFAVTVNPMLSWLKNMNLWHLIPAIVTTCVGLSVLIPKVRTHIFKPLSGFFMLSIRGPVVLEEIRKQLYPNGGGSLFDKVNSTVDKVERISAGLEARALLDTEARFWADPNGRWVSANKSFYRMFRATQEDIEGYSFRNLLDPADEDIFLERWKSSVQLESEFILSVRIRDALKQEIGYANIHAVPIKSKGVVFRWEGIVDPS